MIKKLVWGFTLCAFGIGATAYGASAAQGKRQFENTCAACHGMDGIGVAPTYPNLAGQKNAYLIAQLKAFRNGSRKNPIMSPMAQDLTDAQIANLAAFLSGLKDSKGAPSR